MAGQGRVRVHGAPRTSIDVDLFIQALIMASQEGEAVAVKVLPGQEASQ